MNDDGKTLGRVVALDFQPDGGKDGEIHATFAVPDDTRWAATSYIISEVDVGRAIKRQETVDSLKVLMRAPRYWRDRDPEIIKQVRAGFASLFPETDER